MLAFGKCRASGILDSSRTNWCRVPDIESVKDFVSNSPGVLTTAPRKLLGAVSFAGLFHEEKIG